VWVNARDELEANNRCRLLRIRSPLMIPRLIYAILVWALNVTDPRYQKARDKVVEVNVEIVGTP
jgi:hypothetical protein